MTPEQAWRKQLELADLVPDVNPLDLSPHDGALWFLVQMQGLKFLGAYCLAQDGVMVIWDK